MRRWIIASVVGLAIAASVPATAQLAKEDDGGGVKVRRPSMMRNLVSAAKLERADVAGLSDAEQKRIHAAIGRLQSQCLSGVRTRVSGGTVG